MLQRRIVDQAMGAVSLETLPARRESLEKSRNCRTVGVHSVDRLVGSVDSAHEAHSAGHPVGALEMRDECCIPRNNDPRLQILQDGLRAAGRIEANDEFHPERVLVDLGCISQSDCSRRGRGGGERGRQARHTLNCPFPADCTEVT